MMGRCIAKSCTPGTSFKMVSLVLQARRKKEAYPLAGICHCAFCSVSLLHAALFDPEPGESLEPHQPTILKFKENINIFL